MNPPPAKQPDAPAIRMYGVTAGSMRDPNTILVEDVNWTVMPGECWVIAGLQGTGKTDFLMLTAGLMAPIAGTYLLFGEQMPIFEGDRISDRLRIGFVFDGGQLFNHLTVAENIALPLRYHRNLSKSDADADVRRMLEMCDLEAWADSTPGAIGRNWRKRVGLARALILRPEVLLLDNPLGGLDLRHRSWWLGFLTRLSSGNDWSNGRPTTLIVTADDVRPWRTPSRKFAVLKSKHLVPLGAWEEGIGATDEQLHEWLA